MPPTELREILACPRCDAPLEPEAEGWRCNGCRVDFPLLDGIPWLFAEPGAALDEWRGRWRFAIARLEQELREIDTALQSRDLRAATRSRLERQRAALVDHATRLSAVLAPLAVQKSTGAQETYLALRTRLPADQGLTTYYANVHRDWAWGDEENTASLAIVREALGDAPTERVLVLGAGAGRLAYDLHAATSAATTIALDFNPLLMLLARRLSSGETIELYELPIAPRGDAAVLRTLAAPSAARAGLHFVVADAHRPPFRAGAFDVVVTPWLVDILPERFDALCARINALLAPGGRWANFGSLAFHSPSAVLRYGIDECKAALEDTGYGSVTVTEHEIPYMCSPASRHGRRERVVAWSARKERAAGKLPRYEALPDWIVRGQTPVPLSDSFRSQAMATRVHAFIMSLIDGRRSLKDIAAVLHEQKLLAREEAEGAVRTFLIKMYEDSRRATY